MTCPHCHGELPALSTKYKQRRRAQGLCPDCGGFPQDGYTRCFECRYREAVLLRRRRKARKPS